MSTVVEQTFSDKVAKYFDGLIAFKVTNENGTVFYEKDGVKLQLYQNSVGYQGTFDLTVNKPRYGYSSDSIARVTSKTDIEQKKFRDRFVEQATRAINDELSRQITAPSLERNQKNTEKAFAKWKKDNAKYLEHKIIRSVELEQNWNETRITSIGLDRLITRISTHTQGIPSLTQIFGIIVQSGIKVQSVGSDIQVIGNGEETTALIELIDHFLEWKY